MAGGDETVAGWWVTACSSCSMLRTTRVGWVEVVGGLGGKAAADEAWGAEGRCPQYLL